MKRGYANGLVAALAVAALVEAAWGADSETVRVEELVARDDTPLDRRLNGGVVSYAESLDTAREAVVSVYSTRSVDPESALDPLYRYFFDPDGQDDLDQPPVMRGMGSGVIVSNNGYILTNYHVVEGADEVNIRTAADSEYEAKVVGVDPQTDVAVLKIDAVNLPVATLADSDAIRVGDVVFAIGNPLGIGETVTMGIVSAKGRHNLKMLPDGFENFIQTDASINRGNSGGALVDALGRLIGINTVIVTDGRTSGSIGIGFAVPSNLAFQVMKSLIETGEVARGFLGVSIEPLDADKAEFFGVADRKGALVNLVSPGTPAAEAGLRSGDVIVGIDGATVESPNDLRFKIAQKSPGAEVAIQVIREQEKRDIKVVLARRGPEGSLYEEPRPAGPFFEGIEAEPVSDELRLAYELDESVEGIVVTSVSPDSPYAAQLPEGMVITKVNGQKVATKEEAAAALNQDGKNMLLVAFRGVYRWVSVAIAE